MKRSSLFLLPIVLVASFAFAQIYQWADDEGKVSFGDQPPGDCEFEEVELPEGPSDEEVKAAREKLSQMLEYRRAREEAAQQSKESELLEKQREEEIEAQRFEQCVEARYQLELLGQKRRIFKLLADGSRIYLENEDRPNEISRLTVVRDENCSSDSVAREKQDGAAQDLGTALSRRCAAARATLERMQQPGANPDEGKLADHQVFVEASCPDIENKDLWLGDWILIRKCKE